MAGPRASSAYVHACTTCTAQASILATSNISPRISIGGAPRAFPEVTMATKNDFTEPEWEALQKGLTGAAMLVSLSDRDFADTFGEVGAMAKYLAGQHV